MLPSLPILWLGLSACFDASPRRFEPDPYNAQPTVEITAPSDGAVVILGESTRLVAVATDQDGPKNLVDVAWSSSLQGDLGASDAYVRDGAWDIALDADLSLGEHTIQVTVWDKGGLEASSSIVLTVSETAAPPEITIERPALDASVYVGQTVRLLGTATDARYPLPELQYRWTITDTDAEVVTLPGATVAPDGRFGDVWRPDQMGDWTIAAEVDNPGGGRAKATRWITVGPPPDTDGDGDGVSPADGDCDDTRDDVFPDAEETPDGEDENCNGQIDEGTELFDNDGDGYCADTIECTSPSHQPGDCDDTRADNSPGLPETCGDRLDNNCDGIADEDEAIGCKRFWFDEDGDGYGVDVPPSRCLCETSGGWSAEANGDCNDRNRGLNPGVPEKPNLVDDDCDNEIDEDLEKSDLDGDGYCEDPNACASDIWLPGDCAPADGTIHPGARERCDTPTIDENCNGKLNEDDAFSCATYWSDEDGDGYGGIDRRCLCDPIAPHTATGINLGDCDDKDPRAFPGQPLFFTGKTYGTQSWDFNCSKGVEYERPRWIYQCYFDIDGSFCDTQNLGWSDGLPDCGETSTWSTECRGGFFSCSAKGGTTIQMGCH